MRVRRKCDKWLDGQEGARQRRSLGIGFVSSAQTQNLCRLRHIEITTPVVFKWLSDLGDYRNGVMKRAGGLRDQPSRWLSAMRVLDLTISSTESRRMRDHSESSKRKSHGRR